MILLITIVFNFSLARIFVFLVLLWEIFFCSETFSFSVRLFLSAQELFFWCETFSFSVRLFFSAPRILIGFEIFFLRETFSFGGWHFISPWVFFFPLENIYTENYSTQSENFWSTIQEGLSRLCSLCLVLWARHFYSLQKEEV